MASSNCPKTQQLIKDMPRKLGVLPRPQQPLNDCGLKFKKNSARMALQKLQSVSLQKALEIKDCKQ